MKFKKLKLNSFKSFVEPVDFEIQDGLTGIVGPNGCGKSNVVEAIKWVMGESSAKQMRGDDMDDVIFGGSENRPARDMSEVTVVLDNTEMKTLSQFNEYDELEVKRRIERGKGSSWTINSNSVRAKDVNLLFADNSTGARTSGIVSQGQIANLINAKPETRRSLLEEAANITGLYHRRHEAELRLNAAETNLERLDDVIITMEDQKRSLTKQARQASRYRSVGDRLRKVEAILLLKKYTDRQKDLEKLFDQFENSNKIYIDLTQSLGVAENNRLDASNLLPQLRKKETDQFAVLQNFKINLSTIENELNQIIEKQDKAKTSLEDIKDSTNREKRLNIEAEKVLKKLENENKVLIKDLEKQETKFDKNSEELSKVQNETDKVENKRREIASLINSNKFKYDSLNNERVRLHNQKSKFIDEISSYQNIDNLTKINNIEEQLLKINNEIISFQNELSKLETIFKKASADLEDSKNEYENSSKNFQNIDTELNAIKRIIQTDEKTKSLKLSQKLMVKEGYENSVSHVLGESLEAGLTESSQPHWVKIDNLNQSGYPKNTSPLINFIDNPSLAKNLLLSVGIAKSEDDAKKLQKDLLPGQSITTAKGGLWRWDGFIIPPGSKSTASEILKQSNRMGLLEDEKIISYKKLKNDEKELDTNLDNYAKIKNKIESQNLFLSEKKETKTRLEYELNELILKEGNKKDKNELIQREINLIEVQIKDINKNISKFEEDSKLNSDLKKINDIYNDLRSNLSKLISEQAKLEQNKIFCSNRIKDIKIEKEEWEKRTKDSFNQIEELKIKENNLESEIKNLFSKPSQLRKQKDEILTKIDKQETLCRGINDQVLQSENKYKELDLVCRNIEIDLRTANENKVKVDSEKTVTENDVNLLTESIENKFSCLPKLLLDKVGFSEKELETDLEDLESRERRLIRERDEMGPVNLRAEIEMKELEDQISNIIKESQDLQNAIEKLRTSIKTLNREGKERILISFKKVQEQFKKIFKQLFGGGEAKLEFTDPSDPLNSGLEIMAKPPGKQLQTLSLLSGGEKALTALSLLFAVFLTNPSPLCVLDEVDAPLDDTNVARFCDLLEEIKKATNTRFMIITHHRLTMARMDRLYGVTMTEKGVSQLVSVNLEKAVDLREIT